LQAVPNGTVKALIKVTSYLGADVSDATVKITWTVPKASGAINVTTDARVRCGVRGCWEHFAVCECARARVCVCVCVCVSAHTPAP
jgi:hypothetical protein